MYQRIATILFALILLSFVSTSFGDEIGRIIETAKYSGVNINKTHEVELYLVFPSKLKAELTRTELVKLNFDMSVAQNWEVSDQYDGVLKLDTKLDSESLYGITDVILQVVYKHDGHLEGTSVKYTK